MREYGVGRHSTSQEYSTERRCMVSLTFINTPRDIPQYPTPNLLVLEGFPPSPLLHYCTFRGKVSDVIK